MKLQRFTFEDFRPQCVEVVAGLVKLALDNRGFETVGETHPVGKQGAQPKAFAEFTTCQKRFVGGVLHDFKDGDALAVASPQNACRIRRGERGTSLEEPRRLIFHPLTYFTRTSRVDCHAALQVRQMAVVDLKKRYPELLKSNR